MQSTFFYRWLLLALLLVTELATARAQLQDRIVVVSPDTPARSVRGQTAFDRLRDPSLPNWDVAGWENYDRLWREFADAPDDTSLRKFLGLPIGKLASESTVLKVARGRSAPRWLGWRTGTYQQIESPHFRVYSRADESAGREVARDLERVYWIWTQVFFPYWDGQSQVALHLKNVAADQPVAAQLPVGSRVVSRKKLRVVLFRDADEYQKTLSPSIPGIERSTGFYSDQQSMSFFYPTRSADSVASRRHELVHQLFREATRGSLGSRSPGMKDGFWLVEGIAGYFESMVAQPERSTLGGWDCSRLQFARYRMLASGDRLSLEELFSSGQQQAQRRQDIARWYAHAIARTHQFLDGPNVSQRRWVYQQLSDLYGLKADIPGATKPADNERELVRFLRVNDSLLRAFPPRRDLVELCLAGCEVTESGLASCGQLDELSWLDLSRLPIDNDSVRRLCPQPSSLDRLSLEATRVG